MTIAASPVPTRVAPSRESRTEVVGLTAALLAKALGPAQLLVARDLAATVARQDETRDWSSADAAEWAVDSLGLCLDLLRGQRKGGQTLLTAITAQRNALRDASEAARVESLSSAQLELLLLTTHPVLPRDQQVALCLAAVAGYSDAEIGELFEVPAHIVGSRVAQGVRRLTATRVGSRPPGTVDERRSASLLDTLQLAFDQGWASGARVGNQAEWLCRTTARMAGLVATRPETRSPNAYALAALLAFRLARFPARYDHRGRPVPFHQENRTLWNQADIAEGRRLLARSCPAWESEICLLAAIAGCYVEGATHAQVPWERVLTYFDWLVELNPAPAYAVERAAAVSMVRGGEAGLDALARVSLLVQHIQPNLFVVPVSESSAHRAFVTMLGSLYRATYRVRPGPLSRMLLEPAR